MKKAEDENWIRGMLLDEYRQCQDVLCSLKRKAENILREDWESVSG